MGDNGHGKSIAIQMQQGVGAVEGRLRSNNRAMVMGLTLHGLSEEECARWIRNFRAHDDTSEPDPGRLEIEVELLHNDFSSIGTKSGSKRFPDSLNIVKFDGSILRTETDVVVAPGNSFVICTDREGQLRVRGNKKPELGLRDLIRVSGGGKSREVEISLKLATNITSKAHSGRHFVFRVNAREISPENQEVVSFWGVTDPFELFAKPTASESSHETLRRQASAHSLASLASLASMGLQACESEETAVRQENCDNGRTAANQTRAHPHGKPAKLLGCPGEEHDQGDRPGKKPKIDGLERQESASGNQTELMSQALWQTVLAQQNAVPSPTEAPPNPMQADCWKPPLDYLAALRPDNTATN